MRTVSAPWPEPPLPEGAECKHCDTEIKTRAMKCWRCGWFLPRKFQPVYKRPPIKVVKWSRSNPALYDRTNHECYRRLTARKYWTNQGRLMHKSRSLTTEQLVLAWTMYNQKKTQYEIAEALGVNQSTISRELARFPDTRELAKARMMGAADLMAQHVLRAADEAAKKGDATAALEVLDRTDVLPAKSRNQPQQGGAKIVVVVGTVPGAPLNVQALPEEISTGSAVVDSIPVEISGSTDTAE